MPVIVQNIPQTPGVPSARDLILGHPHRWDIENIPLEIFYEITSYLSLSDIANVQQTCTTFYNLILGDKFYIYYNTAKFFQLYYVKRLFPIFMFQHIHPRFTYIKQRNQLDDDIGFTLDDTDENSEGFTGNTVFHVAASNGIRDIIRFYLSTENSTSIPIFYPSNATFNNEALSSYIQLRPHNANCKLVDLLNEEPNTPLHYISVIPDGVDEVGILEVAKMLIRHGAKIEKKGRAGNTVLAEAAQHGQHGMVRLLLHEYSSLHSSSPDSTNAALAKLISTRNDYEEDAVILSARGHPRVLETLLENGGNPNSQRRGYTLLHIICSRFNLDRHDPSTLHAYHSNLTSPIAWSPRMPRYTDSRSSGPWRTSRNGMFDGIPTAATDDKWPSYKTHDKILQLLIKYGADLHAIEVSTGMKPLHVAAFWGDQSAIEILCKDGSVDPNAEINLVNGWLPVHYACAEGQIFAIQTLIDSGACVWDMDEVESSVNVDEETGELMGPSVPRYPFDIGYDMISQLPLGLHVPAPLELLSIEALKSKIKRFAKGSQK